MKAKSVRIVLRRKIDDWLESIDNEDLREDLRENTIVTGGCIASLLLGEKVNDYDLYFTNKATVKRVAEYYVDKFLKIAEDVPGEIKVNESPSGRITIGVRSAGLASVKKSNVKYRYFESDPDPEAMDATSFIEDAMGVAEAMTEQPKYTPLYLTSNAISLSDKVQIVIRFYGTASEIHSNYDFIHCTNYWKSKDGKLVLRKGALESLLSRELRYIGSKYPICSAIRTRKFIRKGWNINAGQYLKIAYQISKLNLDDLSTLEDQLVGVDTAYFAEILDKIKADGGKPLSDAYLFELIDQVF
jgi:hypothetical protein